MTRKLIFLTICTLLWAGLAQAQGVTTGSLSGVVVDPNGDPLPGVAVVATLPSTGNRYASVADAMGRFRIVNAKVGGPYEVVASLSGFQNITVPDVYIRLGEVTYLEIALQIEAATGEIEVIGESSPLIAPTKMGVASSVSQGSLEALPTLERSVYDFARTNPVFATYSESDGEPTVLSVAGRNPRYNNISIDGAVNNDVFGLADSGTPGGQSGTQPIELDAVQELQLVTSSFDVRQGGFTGGSVNIITKSGTNNFHGGVYGYTSSDSWVGSGPDDFPELGTYDDTEYGFSLGGPLARDKLFFFVNYGHKDYDQPTGYSLDGSTGACFANCGFVDEAQAVRQWTMDTYGYDPGGLGELTRPQPSDKVFVRFDWNFNPSNNLLLRYNYVDAAKLINRPSTSYYEWPSEAYDFKSETDSFVGQWNAVFSDNAFNELRVTYQTVRDRRKYVGEPFPHVYIDDVTGAGDRWEFGSENYSTFNELDTDITEITDDFTFFAGDHEIILGTHNEIYSFRNLFIQNGFGGYSFDDLDAWYAGTAYRYDYTYANDPNNPADTFDTYQLGFYAGDTWRVRPNFTLVGGLRVDIPFFPDTPLFNQGVYDDFGVRTDSIPDGNMLWSPRIGFNWDISDDGTKQLRGGVGLFTGRTPYVWVSNNYGRTGTRQTTIQVYDDITFNPDPDDQPTDIGGASTQDINAIDPDFNFPQTWRANLAYDQRLPWWDMIATAEVLYGWSANEIDYKNLNIEQTGERLPFDNRILYDRVSSDYVGLFYLTNTSKGDATNVILKLEKPYGAQPFWGTVSYTWGEANVVNEGTSSRAISNWQYQEAPDPNNVELSTSDYQIEHRMMVNLNYEFNRQSRWSTVVSVFWNRQSGRPYSTILADAYPYTTINGDRFDDNDLIYVPTGPDDVVLNWGTWEQFEDYLETANLTQYAGQIAPRNCSFAPWITQTDLSIRQNIPIPGKSSLQVSFDMFNFWNLIDDESGHVQYVPYGTVTAARYSGMTDDGKPIYDLYSAVTDPESGLFQIDQLRSRWRMRLGLRWSF
ncbi:MAG: TonB-dependent receptor [Acidobacteria bacterium]|nr:TonB-dependent receptor [Acidobacteriota bacterium]